MTTTFKWTKCHVELRENFIHFKFHRGRKGQIYLKLRGLFRESLHGRLTVCL